MVARRDAHRSMIKVAPAGRVERDQIDKFTDYAGNIQQGIPVPQFESYGKEVAAEFIAELGGVETVHHQVPDLYDIFFDFTRKEFVDRVTGKSVGRAGFSRAPPLSPEEVERRRLGAERFARLYSSNPLWKAKADADPDFWNKFYESQPNS
jgi:hypothetical protein